MTSNSYQSGNLYGYTDYNGPLSSPVGSEAIPHANQEDDEEENPLTCGLWMEGDSLAPPCGTSISTIHALLEFASVSDSDVLYDLGCGDGRVCLEAVAKYKCKQVVGVEIEGDLIAKFRALIQDFSDKSFVDRTTPLQEDLREVVASLVKQERGTNNSNLAKSLPTPSVIVLYLLPEAIAELQSDLLQLFQMLPSLRIVCNTWGFSEAMIRPVKSLEVPEDGGATTTLFLYTPMA